MEREELSFEDIFKDLIEETSKIEIVYDYTERYFKEESYVQYEIRKINGEYPTSFKYKIQKLGKEGLWLLNDELKTVDYEFRVSFLESIKIDVLSLKNIIKDDKIIYEENEYGPREEHNFKSFLNATILPFTEKRTGGHKQSILKKASPYAIEYLEAIDEIANKISFLINQIELLPEPKSAVKDKNTVTIFYSWQSDIDEERRLIWKVLRKIEEHFKSKGKTLKVESDMRGVPGSQDIPNTLFQKISAADIFIADVNLAYKSLIRDDTFSANPNVLIELGFAAAKLDWDRIIQLYNTATYKIEQLPFDIRQRSIVWYTSETELFNKLKFAIGEIIKTENSG